MSGRPAVPGDGGVTVRAHAKLTLALRITGRRDDGYHLLDAEMVSLDLHDLITITPRASGMNGSGLSVSGQFADGVPLDGGNLIARALDLMSARATVHIDKRIPHGGGLGGGSADAAAVLRWAGLTTGTADLVRASKLGADIPFCLVGGHARVAGIGEIIDPLPHLDRVVTLVIPPLRVSTPAAYRAWDELGGPTSDGPNDLEPAALDVEPELRRWRDRIGDLAGVTPVLAGSGATWFTDGDRASALGGLTDEGALVVVARTVPTEVATDRDPSDVAE